MRSVGELPSIYAGNIQLTEELFKQYVTRAFLGEYRAVRDEITALEPLLENAFENYCREGS